MTSKATSAMAAAPATILIVDDDIQNCKLLETFLLPEGYLTRTASSGAEALALIARQVPDLILLDVMMPGMDGYQMARTLKANPAAAHVPIIMVTAKLDRAARLAGLEAGAEEFLTIPVDRAELWLRVRNLLRLKTEIRTRESEGKYRSLIEQASDGIFITDAQGNYQLVNSRACELLGYAESEMIGMHGGMTHVAGERDTYAARLHAIAEGRVLRYERTMKRKDGSVFPAELSAKKLGDDAVQVFFRDITERKRIEQETHETKSFLDYIFENIPYSIFVKDAKDLRYLHVNAGFELMTGHQAKDVQGKCDHDVFSKEQADLYVANDRDTLTGTQRLLTIEETLTARDGTQKKVRTKKFSIPDKEGRPRYLLGMSEDVTERDEAQEMLRKSEARFRGFVEQSPDAMIIHQAGRIIFANDAMARLIRAENSEALIGKSGLSLVRADHAAMAKQRRDSLYAGLTLPLIEQVYLRSDGTAVEVEVASSPLVLEGQPAALVTVREITARKEQERKIARLSRIHAVLSGINSAIVRIREHQELFEEACRIAVDQGRFSIAWIGLVDREVSRIKPVASAGGADRFLAAIEPRLSLEATGAPRGITAMAVDEKRPVVVNDVASDPRMAWLAKEFRDRAIASVAVLPLLVSGEVVGVLALHAEVTGFFDDEEMKLLVELAADIAFSMDHIEKEKKLNYLAYYDALTGLANRSLFLERLAQYMRSAVSGGHKLALFLIDLERFKNINDSLGRPAGDALLKQVAEWLTHNAGDASLLGRLSGDHFAAVLPVVQEEGDVARLLEKSMAAFLDHPFRLNDSVFRIGYKAGVALSPDDGADADTLFRHAEAALKKAKTSGDRYLFYTQKMTEMVAGKLTLENQLRQALDKEEFVLHYQPKVHLVNGKLTSAEALIRWNDPRTGLVPPGRFIPILEETGLIYEAGRWALHKAIEDYLRWRNAGLPAVRIAVNVSPLQLRNRDFITEIRQAIGIDAQAAAGLELEITESLIMEDVKHSIASLKEIRAMGVSIAIDDFGTGFSSLSYLAKLPVDTLKIDRSFVIDMTTGPEGLALVSTIIDLAHSLKLKVVAEGVETEEQSRLLRLLDCDEMQGFLVGKPVPSEIFEIRFLVAARTQ